LIGGATAFSLIALLLRQAIKI